MTKKQQKRVKHVPLRTCIACRTVLAKRSLVRIVRSPLGVVVDPTGKVAGRGAYVHETRACWEKALRGPINQALRTEINQEEMETLQRYIQQLPPDGPDQAPAKTGEKVKAKA